MRSKILAAVIVCGASLALSVSGADLSVTDVESHAAPALVSEINTGFATVETWANAGAVSNATGSIYTSNLTVKAGGTVTVPAGSVAAVSIAAGTLANTMTISNVTDVLYVSNITAVAGATVALPAGSIDATEIGVANTVLALSNACAVVNINGTNYYLKVYP